MMCDERMRTLMAGKVRRWATLMMLWSGLAVLGKRTTKDGLNALD